VVKIDLCLIRVVLLPAMITLMPCFSTLKNSQLLRIFVVLENEPNKRRYCMCVYVCVCVCVCVCVRVCACVCVFPSLLQYYFFSHTRTSHTHTHTHTQLIRQRLARGRQTGASKLIDDAISAQQSSDRVCKCVCVMCVCVCDVCVCVCV